MTVNRTIRKLTVMLLFNVFSLQFTAMFLLFHNSPGTSSIEFLLASCRNLRTQCRRTSSSFLNLISPSYSFCDPNKWILLGAKSGLYGKCCGSSQPIFSIFSTVQLAYRTVGHCHFEEWHLSAAKRVDCCNFLVVINQTVMHHNILHWQKSFKQKVSKNNSPSVAKMLCLQLTVIAICSAPTLTSSLTDWWPLQKRANNSNNLKRDRVWLTNITDNPQKISALATPSVTRKFHFSVSAKRQCQSPSFIFQQ